MPPDPKVHVTRRSIKPAANRDDVVVVTKGLSLSRPLPELAHGKGQALEVAYGGVSIFGVRSYPQLKEYYPKALLRIVDAIARLSWKMMTRIPTIIAGDFNASQDQGATHQIPRFDGSIALGSSTHSA